jgi:hypothetical protein
MDEAWFTGVADELARCLVDADECAAACERLLERLRDGGDADLQRKVLDAVLAPAAVSRVLVELIDHPQQLVLAAARLCRDSAREAVGALEALDALVDADDAIGALAVASGSCGGLIEAAVAQS